MDRLCFGFRARARARACGGGSCERATAVDRYGLAGYIANGIGPDPANKPFALAVIIYFLVCGFLFGFLWSRLDMMRAFAEAETLRRLEEIKSQLDFDTEAMNMVSRQLALDAPEVPVKMMKQVIEKAS